MASNLTAFTNVAALRRTILARDTHNQPDSYAAQQARQNAGNYCGRCGSTSGHYDFCDTLSHQQEGKHNA
jgi:hypothetical protein